MLIETGECPPPCHAKLGLDDQFAVAKLRMDDHAELAVCIPTRHSPGCSGADPRINLLIQAGFIQHMIEKAKR